ncbi:AcrR family transcriptional regulator [Rhodococcus sp. OAS809]|jgi:AcrR family transcriptional regulator|nr:TetR/AcrR family transcriptional regulator [Rhodococcus erythropolis]OQM77931.1 A-factor receptor protein [Rhodococcus sp. 66b]ORI19579.1 TetR family transcriptional regulator [Rhodococcus erythropolis]
MEGLTTAECPQTAGKEPALTDPDDRHHLIVPPEPRQRPRQQRAHETKAKILKAAARSFSIDGYAATSMNDIVAEAASTKGAVYFHFDSKETIARELINHWLTALGGTRQSTDESAIPAIEKLAVFFNGSAALIADDALARAGLRLTMEAGLDTAQPAFREWVELVSRFVDTAIADGQLPASAAQRLAANLCAGFIGAVQVIQVLGDSGDFTSRIDDLVNAYLISDA